MSTIIFLLAIVFLASILQSSTGYGFSIIGTPFLLLLFSAHTAIQINIILSICLSAFMIYGIRKEIDTQVVKKLIIGSLPGLLGGLFIYLFFNIALLKIIVGLVIISVTILLILKFSIRASNRADYFVGGLSGLLTTSIGVPGPPLLLYFTGAHIDKAVLRSTTLAYYLFAYTMSLLLQIVFDGTTKEAWTASMIAIPALFIGIYFGQILFHKLNPFYFKVFTYIILLFTGLYLLYDSLTVYFN